MRVNSTLTINAIKILTLLMLYLTPRVALRSQARPSSPAILKFIRFGVRNVPDGHCVMIGRDHPYIVLSTQETDLVEN